MKVALRWILLLAVVSGVLISGAVQATEVLVKSELDSLAAKIGRSVIEITLPSAGNYILNASQAITVDNLRNITIDDTPPQFATALPTYCINGATPDPTTGICVNNYTDGYSRAEGLPPYPNGTAPYIAQGIQPFGFAYFHHELDDSGYSAHNSNLHDYGSRHGFSVINPFTWRWNGLITHLPVATTQLRSIYAYNFHWNDYKDASGVVYEQGWMSKLGYGDGNYHLLPPAQQLADQLQAAIAAETLLPANQPPSVDKRDPFQYVPGVTQLMIDMEHPYLPSARVTANDCASVQTVCVQEMAAYPVNGTPAEQLAFEQRYYAGFANTYIAAAVVARRMGWPKVATYGNDAGFLSPSALAGTMSGPNSMTIDSDPARYWNYYWEMYGKAVWANNDFAHDSSYTYGWDEHNVASVLANLDFNVARAAGLGKPLRPYLWTRMDQVGNGWWQDLPLSSEDVKAVTALSHFTGMDGLVYWDATPTNNDIYHAPVIQVGTNVMVGTPQTLTPIVELAGGAAYTFKRYDVLHVLALETDAANRSWVTFQVIDKNATQSPYGVDQTLPVTGATHPTYKVDLATLNRNAMPKIGTFPAVFEGFALARAFEYFLHDGTVKIDIPAQQQFKERSPIVRRVTVGRYHLLATYDPTWQRAGYTPRSVTLNDFDGVAGLNLILPADGETRFYVVETRKTDLALTLTSSSSRGVQPGSNVTYTLTVTNNGPADATGVMVSDDLGGAQFVPASVAMAAGSSTSCSGTTTVSCTVGFLAKGASTVLTVLAAAPSDGTLINKATVAETEIDTNPANNSTSLATLIRHLVVTASGTPVNTIYPTMVIRVDGQAFGTFNVTGSTAPYIVVLNAPVGNAHMVDVVFTNDAYSPPQDRNLIVQSLGINSTSLLPNSAGVIYDRGAGSAAFDGLDVIAGQSGMWWNGALRFPISATTF